MVQALQGKVQALQEKVQALQEKVADLQSRNDELQSIVESPEPLVAEAHLKDNDALVAFYTGLPSFSLLMTIYHIASPAILDTARTRLSKFQQFMDVLMKLRLGLTDQDIAYRFRVSQPTISRNFKKWIDAMYIRLKPLMVWPDRDDVRKTMPLEFRTYFGRCIAIIDCFEVFIEQPSNLKAQAQTWSNYKSHNTAKYLIAITPQGTVSFVSKGWGGRVSDQHLTTELCIRNLLHCWRKPCTW